MEGSARGSVPFPSSSTPQRQEWKHREACPTLKQDGAPADAQGSRWHGGGMKHEDVDGCSAWSRAALARGLVLMTLRNTALAHVETQPSCRESANFQFGGLAQLTRADDPRLASSKKLRPGGPAVTRMMVTSRVTQSWSGTKLAQKTNVTYTNVGSVRTPQKTAVICLLDDLES